MKDRYDYYYGQEADQFSFYRIPKVLFTNDKFSKLSCEAKVLYGLMLDRMGLSMKNKWVDEQNRVYIYFKLEDVMMYLNCGHDKGVKLLAELDGATGIGLIERRKQGMGKPNRIYVMNYIIEEESIATEEQKLKSSEKQEIESGKKSTVQTSENQNNEVRIIRSQDFRKSEVKTSENQKYRLPKTRSKDFGKSDSNNTNINNTEISNTELNSIHPSILSDYTQQQSAFDGLDKMGTYQYYRNLISENIGFEALCHDYRKERVEEILDLITDIVCTSQDVIRISGQDWSAEAVRSRFLKLDMFHIQYVFDCLDRNTTEIHNIRAYLLSSLYNAPTTMGSYYTARVNYDMYGK